MGKKLSSVFISTYSYLKEGVRTNNSGPVIPLTNFFTALPGVTVYILEQFLPGSDEGRVLFRKYRDGRKRIETWESVPLTPRDNRRLSNNKTYMRLKVRDLLSDFLLFSRHVAAPVDLFIGLECVNACFGALQKRRGLCRDSVYYIFDWAPDRYSNKLINAAYLWLDKMACYHNDYTWNITDAIGDARLGRLGYDERLISPQLYVPYSYDHHSDHIASDDDIDPNLILYAGGLIEENGPGLLIEAFALVLGRFPDARLRIIGGGNDEPKLRERIRLLTIDDRVEITGYISQEDRVMQLQKKAGIAVAPYPKMRGSRKPYGDVIKIRMYFASGLPVVSTPVPPVVREIRAEGLGTVTRDDSPEAIADAICHYLANPSLIFETRRRVAAKASTSSWRDNFRKTLFRMGYDVG